MENSRLYAIIDVNICDAYGFGVLDFASQVCLARPGFVQLRAKHSTPRITLELLRGLVALAHPLGIQVFANDRPDLASLGGADGVHVGQNDLPVSRVQKYAKNLRVGVSTHNEAELRKALNAKPDYIAMGPIFATNSKKDAETCVGISGLVSAAQLARAEKIPLVAIGGIHKYHAQEVAKYADAIAVISALVPKSGRLQDVQSHVEELISIVASDRS